MLADTFFSRPRLTLWRAGASKSRAAVFQKVSREARELLASAGGVGRLFRRSSFGEARNDRHRRSFGKTRAKRKNHSIFSGSFGSAKKQRGGSFSDRHTLQPASFDIMASGKRPLTALPVASAVIWLHPVRPLNEQITVCVIRFFAIFRPFRSLESHIHVASADPLTLPAAKRHFRSPLTPAGEKNELTARAVMNCTSCMNCLRA